MLKNIFSKDSIIGIFGFGITGRAVAKWCNVRNLKTIIFDEKVANCEQFSKEKIAQCSIIIRSPSFLENNEWVRYAKSCGIHCIGELDLAAHFWRGKIIAVTGTDGKTTTTEFLTHALKHAGLSAIAVGNNGQPLISFISSEFNHDSIYAVVEVSSFQAESLCNLQPDYVIWTNFATDHINVHNSLENYFYAKYNLIKLCKFADSQHIFVGESVEKYARLYGSFNIIGKQNVHVKFSSLPTNSALNIPAQHKNYALVEALWQSLRLSLLSLQEAACSYMLPRHRLQKIATVQKQNNDEGVEFWNDSKATNFHSFQAALYSFNRKLIIIVGGRSKGEDLEQYVEVICKRAKSVLLLGETGAQIYEKLIKKRYKNEFDLLCYYGSDKKNAEKILSKIVNDAFCVALPGDVVLLSPGFASFDMFENFEKRGDFYEKYVLRLCF